MSAVAVCGDSFAGAHGDARLALSMASVLLGYAIGGSRIENRLLVVGLVAAMRVVMVLWLDARDCGGGTGGTGDDDDIRQLIQQQNNCQQQRKQQPIMVRLDMLRSLVLAEGATAAVAAPSLSTPSLISLR